MQNKFIRLCLGIQWEGDHGKYIVLPLVRFQATFEKLENELREVNQNAEALKRNYLELTELKHILRKTQGFFDEVSVKLEFTALCKKKQFYVKLYVFNF